MEGENIISLLVEQPYLSRLPDRHQPQKALTFSVSVLAVRSPFVPSRPILPPSRNPYAPKDHVGGHSTEGGG